MHQHRSYINFVGRKGIRRSLAAAAAAAAAAAHKLYGYWLLKKKQSAGKINVRVQ
jgi:hypothetical protein